MCRVFGGNACCTATTALSVCRCGVEIPSIPVGVYRLEHIRFNRVVGCRLDLLFAMKEMSGSTNL